MKYRKLVLAAALLLAAVAVSAAALQREQTALSEKLIRLHVVANSDSNEDQTVKLKVRDAVLSVTEPLLRDAASPEELLQENLSAIESAAVACLRSNGFDDPVTVSLAKEDFPTRNYADFALPAGVYTSLRVTIGAGEGKNWWCVVFPSICLRAAGDLESVAASAGFSKQEIGLITEGNSGYVLKFKFMELLQILQRKIAGRK